MATAADTKMDSAIADAAAEKAYAAAAEKAELSTPKAEAPQAPATAAAALVPAPVGAKVEAPKPAPAAKAKKVSVTKTVKTATAPAKKSAPAVAKKAAAKPAKKIAKTVTKAAPKKSVVATLPTFSKLKDTIMAKTQTTTEDFTAKLSTVAADVQERAKAAYEKGTVVVGEYTEFSKGNVEALVEAGKIFAAGVQDMGSAYVAEAKSAFETVTADVKELAAVKSPTDFFKLQGEILRRNFDAAVAAGSKNSEAVLKLANDAFAPLSSRVSLAIEKVKKAA
ncbi:MAG TPA: phasin family protein [Novosphingobium sp.]|nr:phasin family protein [Novosphingobium sp.]